MEVLDLYDDNGNKLDEEIIRGNKPELGKNIMLSVIYIKNNEGKYIIQKTSKEKGNKYSTTGGHVIKGENALTTIIRELKEELGLNINKERINHIKTIKYPTKQCIFNIYELCLNDNELKNIVLQKEEVESVFLYSQEEIIKIIEQGNFLESHAYIFQRYIKNTNY